jgi:prevent-host-death family protein
MTSKATRSKSLPSSRKPKRKRGSTTRVSHPKRVALAKVKDDFSRYLKLAASEEIVITRHGRAAGVLIGFESEEAWFEYRLEHHPGFLRQVRSARADLAGGHGIRLEDIPK